MPLGREHTGREAMMVMTSAPLPGRPFKYIKFDGFEDSGGDCMMVPLLDPVKLNFKMTSVDTKSLVVIVIMP